MNITTLDTRAVRRWKRYPDYRPSGIEWLPQLPSQWQMKRLKCLATPSRQRLFEKPQDATYIGLEQIESKTGKLLLDNPVETVESNMGVFVTGDVLFGKLRPYLAKVAAPNFAGVCTTELSVYRPKPEIHSQYLKYQMLVSDFIDFVNALAYGTKMPRVSEEQMSELQLAVPPLPEQRAIAAFLDRETARIDALIGHKERLVALLEEKRQAVLSRAVTRGLDPASPLKDSELPFVGEIPTHWNVKALGHTLQLISYGFTNPMPSADEGPFLLTANDIGEGRILFETARRTTWNAFTSLLTNKSRPQQGDLLITKDGTLGRTAICDGTVCCINQSVAILRIDPAHASVEYIHEALQSTSYQERIILDAGGTTIKHIYISRLAKMPVAFPPISEQRRIAEYCENKRKELYRLIGRIRDGIDRLQEYRTALISAAVTGQIDVRGEVTP